MRRILPLFAVVLLLLSACDKPEEILPLPPQSEETLPPASAEEFIEETRPSIDFDSDLYQSALFENMPYRILLPRDYDSTKTYPLHIFLHGILPIIRNFSPMPYNRLLVQ